MNVAELLSAAAGARPGNVAIIDAARRRTLTFAQLDDAAACAAAAFSRHGLVPGDRVIVLHPMSADLYVGIAGLLRAGCVPVICDPSAGRAYFAACCKRATPRAIFGSVPGLLYARTVPALSALSLRFSIGVPGTHDIMQCSDWLAVVPRAGCDAAIMTFTSGSTGMPKAVVRTHGILRAQLEAIRRAVAPAGPEISTMPIVLLANLASGVTSIIPAIDLRRPGAADPHPLIRDIQNHKAQSIVASPALLERLALAAEPESVRSLRRIVTGGAPVFPGLILSLRALLPQARILSVYGSTEAEPIALLDTAQTPLSDLAAMQTGNGLLAGTPVDAARVRIESGEICVAGPHVVPGYLDGIGDDETKFRSGGMIFHRTGDLGYFDDEGRLWLLGRKGASIADSRGTIAPFSIECALSFEKAIARCALVSVAGERVIVLEERRGHHIEEQRIERTLRWAKIDRMQIVRRIPVDSRHNAKVDYPALRRMIGASV